MTTYVIYINSSTMSGFNLTEFVIVPSNSGIALLLLCNLAPLFLLFPDLLTLDTTSPFSVSTAGIEGIKFEIHNSQLSTFFSFLFFFFIYFY